MVGLIVLLDLSALLECNGFLKNSSTTLLKKTILIVLLRKMIYAVLANLLLWCCRKICLQEKVFSGTHFPRRLYPTGQLLLG